MSAVGTPLWMGRFLAPRHALDKCAIIQWQGRGVANTPAADAQCRMLLALAEDETRIAQAAFAMFGPPVAIACADWACEWLADRTITAARSLNVQDFEQALSLAPEQRYGALLVVDALANALDAL